MVAVLTMSSGSPAAIGSTTATTNVRVVPTVVAFNVPTLRWQTVPAAALLGHAVTLSGRSQPAELPAVLNTVLGGTISVIVTFVACALPLLRLAMEYVSVSPAMAVTLAGPSSLVIARSTPVTVTVLSAGSV